MPQAYRGVHREDNVEVGLHHARESLEQALLVLDHDAVTLRGLATLGDQRLSHAEGQRAKQKVTLNESSVDHCATSENLNIATRLPTRSLYTGS